MPGSGVTHTEKDVGNMSFVENGVVHTNNLEPRSGDCSRKAIGDRTSMEETFSDRRRRDEEVKQRISEKLTQSGEREKLKELLRHKLIECGWRDEMKAHCKEVIRSKGIDHVTVDDLIDEITPKARATVPENIKGEMLDKIKAFIEKDA